jgi:hypothetical protein
MIVYIEPSTEHFYVQIKAMLEERYRDTSNDAVIFIGYNLVLSLKKVRALYPGKKIIVYQFEQHEKGRPWTTSKNKAILQSADEVWDYDLDNIEWLKKNWKISATFHPILYADCLKRDDREPENDVIFYGAHNDRRDKIFQGIVNAGIKAQWIGAYGEDLMTQILNAKIILNIHHYMPPRQEQTRIFLPIINSRLVISEWSPRNYFGGMIVESAAEDLAKKCSYYLRYNTWKGFANQAHLKFKQNGVTLCHYE